ncbi:MAG: 50S ribosomal protein L7/L12 [Candidatus Omnitrophica bacterium]|nr:50S ribosomal protein L7/L12 [Candidatus Omnitrophota bacterium]
MKEETQEKPQAKKSSDVPSKLQKIMESIEQLTVLELAQLVKALEEKFGVSAQAAVAVAAVPGAAQAGAGAGAAAGEEKTTFQVILSSTGDKKINVIKEIRTVTSLGLKEAKDLVESAPKVIKDNASKEEAAKIKATLEAAGAKVEIK